MILIYIFCQYNRNQGRMKPLIYLVCTVVLLVNTAAVPVENSMLYPTDNLNNRCKTPKEEDGRCVKISECEPEDRNLYITEDRRTTDYLRYPVFYRYTILFHVFAFRESACGFDTNTPKICCSVLALKIKEPSTF